MESPQCYVAVEQTETNMKTPEMHPSRQDSPLQLNGDNKITLLSLESAELKTSLQNYDSIHSSGYSDAPRINYETIVRLPYDHVASSPTKGVREKLITAFNTWYQVPATTLERIIKAVGILHTASLLIDDIQDDSLLRRGSPAAHTIYGVPQTINSANYMYFQALEELSVLQSPQIHSIFSYELLRLHLGQGMELYWRDTLQCPTEQEYLTMISNKTGGLFRLAIKLLECESTKPSLSRAGHQNSVISGLDGADNMIIALAEDLGIVFQIRDDYQNLASSEYRDQKGSCEDLTEGKFSYPVIHSINHEQRNPQLLQLLKLKSTREEVKQLALSCLEATGSLSHTRETVLSRIARLRPLVDGVQSATGGLLDARPLHLLIDSLEKGL